MKPYQYQEYPRTLHRPDGKTKTVHNDGEKAEALAEGWNLRPGPAPTVAEAVNAFVSAVGEIFPLPAPEPVEAGGQEVSEPEPEALLEAPEAEEEKPKKRGRPAKKKG